MIAAIIIFVCAGLAAFYEFYKSQQTKDLLMGILLFVGAIASLIQTLSDSDDTSTIISKTDSIEKLEKLDSSFSVHLDSLASIDTSLASKNNLLSLQIKNLSHENIKLTDSVRKIDSLMYIIVKSVDNLSNQNFNLSQKINQITQEEINRNTLTGELNLKLQDINPNSKLKVFLGNSDFGNFLDPKSGNVLGLDEYVPIKLNVANNNIFLTIDIYDYNHNFLVHVENNKWRINSRFKNNLNYDDKGFEVLDEQDNVVFSINYLPKENYIKIQGVFFYNNLVIICGDSYFRIVSIAKLKGNIYDAVKGLFKTLFVYTGSKYLHQRVD